MYFFFARLVAVSSCLLLCPVACQYGCVYSACEVSRWSRSRSVSQGRLTNMSSLAIPATHSPFALTPRERESSDFRSRIVSHLRLPRAPLRIALAISVVRACLFIRRTVDGLFIVSSRLVQLRAARGELTTRTISSPTRSIRTQYNSHLFASGKIPLTYMLIYSALSGT